MSTKQLRAGVGVLLISVSALVCGGLWAWSRGLSGPYHFDDYVTPLDDPASQSLAEWRRHLAGTLRPATKLTYALEAETSVTGTPAARRIVSILLHGVSAGLLLLLIRRLAPGVQLLGATLLAVFWFVHPVHADGVLLASGRTTVLSNLFVIASLLALDRSWRWLAALFFVLACLSRETAIAALLPLAVLAPRSTSREMAPGGSRARAGPAGRRPRRVLDSDNPPLPSAGGVLAAGSTVSDERDRPGGRCADWARPLVLPDGALD
jgi:hypothetical protein